MRLARYRSAPPSSDGQGRQPGSARRDAIPRVAARSRRRAAAARGPPENPRIGPRWGHDCTRSAAAASRAGLQDYPARDEEVRRLAAEIWGQTAEQPYRRSVGKGRIISGSNIEEELSAEGIPPDCAGPCEYIHRRAGDVDIYFVSGYGEMECTFRVGGRQPELWDPKTGAIHDAICFRTADNGRTIVPLSLPENGSAFVVFRKPIRQPHLVRFSCPQPGAQIEGRSDAGVLIRLWEKGRYVLDTSQGKQLAVDVAAMPGPLTVGGPWEVHFAAGWGAPESVVFPELLAWEKHENPGIRFFSGTATYRKTIRLSSQQVAAASSAAIGRGEVRRPRAAQREGSWRGMD